MEFLSRLVLDAPAAVLSWLGRQGTRAVAALVVIGIVLPPIGALLKPFVTETVFVLLCIAFLRVDVVAFRIYFGRPMIVLAATAWTSLVIPTLFGAIYLVFGLKDQPPDLFLALVLQAIASPLMAAPAFAALMGLDATLVLCTMVTSTAMLPFTAPLLAYVFIGPSLTLSPLALGLKLFAILAGSALVGFTVRRRWPRCYRAAERKNRWLQHSRPVRLHSGHHGRRRRSPSRHAHDHNWTRRACLRGILRGALPDHPLLCIRGLGARPYARIHGLATQCGAHVGGDRWRLARPHLAVFRLLLLPYVSVAATTPTVGGPNDRASADYCPRT
jgi:hypothetical protein